MHLRRSYVLIRLLSRAFSEVFFLCEFAIWTVVRLAIIAEIL